MRYSAFISYNHADKKWANWLHKALETYQVPAHLRGRESPIGPLTARLPPVYQDREEMVSSADLGQAVKASLENSATLIVLCSPAAVSSRWVNEEIRTFHALGRSKFIHCMIVGGEPHASRKPGFDSALECFPPALLELGLVDPVAPDVRPGTDGKTAAKLRLLAGMLGVAYDDLRQREAARQNRRLIAITCASLAGLAVTSGLAIYARAQRNEAVEQRDIARQKTMTAERTVDFIKSIFQVADPSEAQGVSISAREILDQSERRLSQSLVNEPEVKAELMVTLAEVYGGLGLYSKSDILARKAWTIPNLARSKHAAVLTAMGESEMRLGAYRTALATFQKGLNIADEETESRLLIGLSAAQSAIGKYAEANNSAQAALNLALANESADSPVVANALEAVADNAYFQDHFDIAKPLFLKATNLREKAQGVLHPKVLDNFNTLGSIAYLQNEPEAAEDFFRRVVKARTFVLGKDHPNVATAMNNLARVLLEQRKFSDTASLLAQSVAISLKQLPATHEDMAFLFANLALAQHGLGQTEQAELNFRKAMVAARMHNHRNLAPILADLANILCEQKRFVEAFRLLEEAAPIMAKTYPADPWRPAWVAQVRGRCLFASGDRESGRAQILSSAKALQDRWPANSLYGHAVKANLGVIGT